MLALRIAFGTFAAARAVLVYGEAGPMQEPGWAHERAERVVRGLRPIRGTRPAWHTANP
jgi:hypothetical protein